MNNEGVLMSGKGLWTQGFIAGVPKAVSKSNQGGILTPGKGVFTKYIKLKKKNDTVYFVHSHVTQINAINRRTLPRAKEIVTGSRR
jgi:hypothetical protein